MTSSSVTRVLRVLAWPGLLAAGWSQAGEAPAGAPILSGPEFALSPGPESQRLPALAWGGGVFLAVWQQGWNGVGGNSDILAHRLKPGTGLDPAKPLDPEPLKICAQSEHQEAPQVAFAGGVFLVVWHDFRNGQDADVYAARVTPEGKLLDPEGIPVAVRSHNQNFPLLTTDGRDFLVLWREIRYGQTYDLVAARVQSASGKVVEEKGVLIAKNPTLPAAGFSGKQYVIAWIEGGRRGNKLGFARFNPQDLTRIENEPTPLGHPDAFGHSGQVRLVSGQQEVIALWARGVNPDPWGWGGPGAMLSMRIRDDGSVPENQAFNKIRWSPEGREQYVKRILPGVLDTAHWQGFDGWPQGKPGGFKEATGGLWPHAYLSGTPLPGATGQYFAVWVRAHLKGLTQTGRLDIMGGRLRSGEGWEAPDYPPAELSATGSSTLPAVSGSEAGQPFLLLYEQRREDGQALVMARFLKVEPVR